MSKKSVHNQAANALHLMTAAIASFKAGVTSMDAAIDAARAENLLPAEELDQIEKDLEHAARRMDKLETSKTALHERVSRHTDGAVLRIGT
jgi:chromosome segregation ATPase